MTLASGAPLRLHRAALLIFAVDAVLFYLSVPLFGVVGQNVVRAAAAGSFAWVLASSGALTREDMGLGRAPGRFASDALWTLKVIAVLLGVSAVLLGAAVAIARLTGGRLPLPQEIAEPSGIPYYLVTSVVMAPLVEEFVYRGLMTRGLESAWGRRGAVAAGAVVFYALHLVYARPLSMVHYLAAGAILTWVFLERRRLWICVVLHAGGNLLVVFDDALRFFAPGAYDALFRAPSQ